MRTLISSTILFITVFILLAGCSNQKDDGQNDSSDLMVSAAISLTDALDDIKDVYESDHDVTLTFNLGSSGKLAQQIENDAPSDIFISANQDWMDRLEDNDKINSDSRTDLTGNSIVLISGKNTDLDVNAISDIPSEDLNQIAVGNPDSVPAGKYTEQALKDTGIWDDIQDNIILAKDVRQVLTYVETGNTDIGFVYKSDALTSDNKVDIIAEVAGAAHDPIIYPGAITKESDQKDEASAFLDFLTSDEAQEIFETYGFTN